MGSAVQGLDLASLVARGVSGGLRAPDGVLREAAVGWGAVATATLLALLAYAALEQAALWRHRRRSDGTLLPGPSLFLPFLGALVQMVRDPYQMWEDQRLFSFPGLSMNSLLGRLMIFSTDTDISRKMLSHNDPATLLMAVHPSGKHILGEGNLAFMHGPPHKAIRASFLALFTRKALGTYVVLQDGIIRRTLAEWLAAPPGFREVRGLVRDMNAATSQEVFAGPYLDDPRERQRFGAAFADMTQGFLALPICLPGTAVWRAKQGRLYILGVLEKAAQRSKAAMQAGVEPRCLMDYWAQRCLEEEAAARAGGTAVPGHCSGRAMADTVMDFLFASQDASTASLVWLLCLLADRPELLARVREEQARVRPDPGAVIDGAVLRELPFTRQVVREVLRFRPPAPMVPQVVQQPFQLTETYTAPKGALLMPSLIASSMQGFEEPGRFDPDRFGPGREEDVRCAKHFLVFGCGPHYCVGREYAINHLTAFLALLATSCTWERRRTPQSADDARNWKYLPTIYPHDSLIAFQPLPASGGAPAKG